MAGYNYAQNIIGLKKGAGDIHELEVEVANLSASVLTIGEKVEELEDDIIAFDFNITIRSTTTGLTTIYGITNVPANYTVISFTPIYNADLFHYNGAKEGLNFSFGDQTNTVRVTIRSGSLGDTEDRTLSFKAIAKKNVAQTTT